MTLRPYTPADYELLAAWWKQWGWPVVPPHALPGTGFIAFDEEPLAACFLYRTDSSIAWVEWITGNPNVTHARRVLGVERVLLEAMVCAASWGARSVFSSAKHPTICDLYERAGFNPSDRDMINWVRSL